MRQLADGVNKIQNWRSQGQLILRYIDYTNHGQRGILAEDVAIDIDLMSESSTSNDQIRFLQRVIWSLLLKKGSAESLQKVKKNLA